MNGYVLELAWGCPSEKYQLNGIFQFDQASALKKMGINVIFSAVDVRSFRRKRKWGMNKRIWKEMEVYEFNFPFGPIFSKIRRYVEKKCFESLIRIIIREKGKPEYIHIHNCEVALCAVDFCVRSSIPYIVTEHSTPRGGKKNLESKKKYVYENAQKTIAVSHSLADKIIDLYGVKPVVIHNIVRTKETDNYEECRIEKDDCFRFVSAARLVKGKGFLTLIDAFAKLLKTNSKVSLDILGDGPERAVLMDAVKKKEISKHVSFFGEYRREDLEDILKKSDCFVLASESETFGIVFIEAMSCGVPVIATMCGGPEDYVCEDNGVLVPVNDSDSLAAAMEKMINHIELYDRKLIAKQCRDRFSERTIAAEIIKVIEGSK